MHQTHGYVQHSKDVNEFLNGMYGSHPGDGYGPVSTAQTGASPYGGGDKFMLYRWALLLIELPLLLIGNAIGQVFFQRAAATAATGESLCDLVEQVLRRLIWISILPALAVALIGADFFEVFLGERWREAGLYAQFMAGWLFLAGIASPISTLLEVMERLTFRLIFNVAMVVGQVAALIAGGWFLKDAKWTMVLLGISGAIVNAALCWYLLLTAGVSFGRTARYLLRYALYALPTLAAGACAKFWMQLPAWGVVTATAVASLTYWALVLHDDREVRSIIWDFLTHRGGENT